MLLAVQAPRCRCRVLLALARARQGREAKDSGVSGGTAGGERLRRVPRGTAGRSDDRGAELGREPDCW